MGYEPQALRAKHFLAAALQAMGLSNIEVAHSVGFTKEYISLLSQSSLFQAEVQRLTLQLQSKLVTDAAKRLEAELHRNIDTMIEVRDNTNVGPAVRLRAANDLMDHVPGMSRNARSAPPEAVVQFTDTQAQLFLKALADDPAAQAAFATPEAAPEEPEELFDMVESLFRESAPPTEEE